MWAYLSNIKLIFENIIVEGGAEDDGCSLPNLLQLKVLYIDLEEPAAFYNILA